MQIVGARGIMRERIRAVRNYKLHSDLYARLIDLKDGF